MQDTGLTDMVERVVAAATALVLGGLEDAREAMGDRPAGYETLTPNALLEQYIEAARQPQGLAMIVARTMQRDQCSRPVAETLVARFETKALRMLARRGTGGTVPTDPEAVQRAVARGVEAVEAGMGMQRLQRAAGVLREVEQIEGRPKALIVAIPPAPAVPAWLLPEGAPWPPLMG